ncbi:MAG: hypothetical protein JWN78_978 [Bacteroidota bacterium]|nr:hypothetical protein [Bacteroidota bacterium]
MKTCYLACISFLFLMSCKKENASDSNHDQTEINKLKINQIQILGSHNSYHKHMDPKLFSFLSSINFLLPDKFKVEALDYSHEPLADQLDIYHLRSFEIDIYADPQGGRYYNRQGNVFIGKPVASGIDELRQPGFKVLHIPDIDFETHFYTFKSNLQALKDWSDAHPDHLPIFILIESKEETVGDILGFLGFITAIKFTPALADDIDTEIKSVFGSSLDNVITPDNVRGTYATLKDAVLADNWPTVGSSRGKFLFAMEGPATTDYLNGHPSLQGRAMFLITNAGLPESAVIGEDVPDRFQSRIMDEVKQGYIIRTRADEANHENLTGDYSRQQAAFASGAQMISTDYYRPDPRYLTDGKYKNYMCQFPNGDLARINPVSAADKQGIGVIAE